MIEKSPVLWYPITMKKCLFVLAIFAFLSLFSAPPVLATQGSVLGIHILAPGEIQNAKELLTTKDSSPDEWHYVTVPLTLDDVQKPDEWKKFFQYAHDQKLIPIVRLATHFENGAWQVPTKKNIVDLITFLSTLNWPTNERYIIAFNEVNHANEWGNSLDPATYADTLRFTSDWAKSEGKNYLVLPAAMDLAAPNGGQTMEAFHYLDQMQKNDPQV